MKDFYLLAKFWKEHITARAPHAFLYPKAHVRMRIDPIDVAFEVSVPAFQKPRIVCAAACISFQGLQRPQILLSRARAILLGLEMDERGLMLCPPVALSGFSLSRLPVCLGAARGRRGRRSVVLLDAHSCWDCVRST